MRPIRVYADTSVFGGVFDDAFAKPSRTFFDQVRQERFRLVSSALVRDEIAAAPDEVRMLFEEMDEWMEVHEIRDEGVDLQLAYLDKGIVGEGCLADALHVAMATVLNSSVLLSWNFRHIVHFQKVPLYNAVNRIHGYPEIIICAPQEVINYEEETI
jgi:hypothetical protein